MIYLMIVIMFLKVIIMFKNLIKMMNKVIMKIKRLLICKNSCNNYMIMNFNKIMQNNLNKNNINKQNLNNNMIIKKKKIIINNRNNKLIIILILLLTTQLQIELQNDVPFKILFTPDLPTPSIITTLAMMNHKPHNLQNNKIQNICGILHYINKINYYKNHKIVLRILKILLKKIMKLKI